MWRSTEGTRARPLQQETFIRSCGRRYLRWSSPTSGVIRCRRCGGAHKKLPKSWTHDRERCRAARVPTVLGQIPPRDGFTVLREVSQHTIMKLTQVAEQVLRHGQGAALPDVLLGELHAAAARHAAPPPRLTGGGPLRATGVGVRRWRRRGRPGGQCGLQRHACDRSSVRHPQGRSLIDLAAVGCRPGSARFAISASVCARSMVIGSGDCPSTEHGRRPAIAS